MAKQVARNVIRRMLVSSSHVLHEESSNEMQRRHGRVVIGRGHLLADERDVEVMLALLRRPEHPLVLENVLGEWRYVQSGTGQPPSTRLSLDTNEVDRLLDHDLEQCENLLERWFDPRILDPLSCNGPMHSRPPDTLRRNRPRGTPPASRDFHRLPSGAQLALLYFCLRLGARHCNPLREIAVSRDWLFIGRLLRLRDDGVHGCDQRLIDMARSIGKEAIRHLAGMLEGLPVVAHRVLAEEFEYVIGNVQRGRRNIAPSANIQEAMLGQDLSALCLSGGGIRSASFCLGAIQALCAERLFGQFHYLSTVSGGGYIGTAITRWMVAKVDEDFQTPAQALEDTQQRLQAFLGHDYVKGRVNGGDFETEGTLTWLRMHSNYLSRRLSFFSADTWTVVSTYLRNLVIIWLIFWPWVALFLLVPWFSLYVAFLPAFGGNILRVIAGGVGALTGVLGASYFLQNFEPVDTSPAASSATNGDERAYANDLRWPRDGDNRAALGAVLLLVACFLIAWALPARPAQSGGSDDCPGLFVVVTGTIAIIQWILAGLRVQSLPRVPPGRAGRIRLSAAGATAVQAGSLAIPTFFLSPPPSSSPLSWALYALYFPACIFAALLVGETVKVALRSAVDPPEMREHQGRAQSFMVMIAAMWLFSAMIVVLVPIFLDWQSSLAPAYTAAASGLTLSVTIYYGYRPVSPGNPEARPSWLFTVAGLVGMVLLAAIVSLGAWSLIKLGSAASDVVNCQCVKSPLTDITAVNFCVPYDQTVCKLPTAQCVDRSFGAYLADTIERLRTVPAAHTKNADPLRQQCWLAGSTPYPSKIEFHPRHLTYALLVILLSLFVTALLGRLIRINEFSLHGFYRDRLVRGFYGGFRGFMKPRQPHLFSGFDSRDDIRFARVLRLYRRQVHKHEEENRSLKPPFLVVCTALNLLKGTALAWQERKADSFTFTALHAGNYRLGYRSVGRFAGGVRLGTAMAISGAAFNSNMGYNSSTPLAFLMSVFNVRLGWWLGNPRHIEPDSHRAGAPAPSEKQYWRKKDPPYPAWTLLQEAAGQTSDEGKWIHLSDGGHFDNMGLWEMVYRRCRRILVIDASQDRAFCLEDFYSAVRKIRIDMGIEIEPKEPVQLFPRAARASGSYFACFTIKYPRSEKNDEDNKKEEDRHGTIIYLKPCVYGIEPPDVLEYADKCAAFPHEPTADQFFTESQFESYRKLGEWEMCSLIKQRKDNRSRDEESGRPCGNPAPLAVLFGQG
ncbi:patatin-like phospholipase family protein [Caballeronia novacaledonica]|uniref:Patatin-like phospholipase n=1 Tax=Caballeronia novacaledonica TaxID=1544861 RepID=A0AA37IFL3_9BURK|nr:patatin-like phospholipase family protein [Caballeronia novacaledonica]GJH28956.1 hypothetical protein CBA19CS42_30590 [Caballeronia novacaledonica]